MDLMETVRRRRSVRSFDGRGLPAGEREEILRFAEASETPYGLAMEWRILDAKDRNEAGPTAPAHGLTLLSIRYPEWEDGKIPE